MIDTKAAFLDLHLSIFISCNFSFKILNTKHNQINSFSNNISPFCKNKRQKESFTHFKVTLKNHMAIQGKGAVIFQENQKF